MGIPSWYTDWWTLEVACSVLSIACTIAIVVVLICINGKFIETWHSWLQPNTIVSILSTVAKSALLLPFAECISQQKWELFRSSKPRKLEHMDMFDQASRGPYGAVWLLFSSRSFSAILGAFVVLVALGMDPFIQQVIAFEPDKLALD